MDQIYANSATAATYALPTGIQPCKDISTSFEFLALLYLALPAGIAISNILIGVLFKCK